MWKIELRASSCLDTAPEHSALTQSVASHGASHSYFEAWMNYHECKKSVVVWSFNFHYQVMPEDSIVLVISPNPPQSTSARDAGDDATRG